MRSNVNLGIWDKLTKAVVFLLFVAGGLLVAVWYFPLLQQNERMRKELLRFEDEVRRQELTNRELRAAVEAGRNDPKTIERQARESLGYAKPDEVVIHFEEPNRPAR